jgi:hypothetical protein
MSSPITTPTCARMLSKYDSRTDEKRNVRLALRTWPQRRMGSTRSQLALVSPETPHSSPVDVSQLCDFLQFLHRGWLTLIPMPKPNNIPSKMRIPRICGRHTTSNGAQITAPQPGRCFAIRAPVTPTRVSRRCFQPRAACGGGVGRRRSYIVSRMKRTISARTTAP